MYVLEQETRKTEEGAAFRDSVSPSASLSLSLSLSLSACLSTFLSLPPSLPLCVVVPFCLPSHERPPLGLLYALPLHTDTTRNVAPGRDESLVLFGQ